MIYSQVDGTTVDASDLAAHALADRLRDDSGLPVGVYQRGPDWLVMPRSERAPAGWDCRYIAWPDADAGANLAPCCGPGSHDH